MKFDLNDFLELDTNGLLAVNGGHHILAHVSIPTTDTSHRTITNGGHYGGSCSSGGTCGRSTGGSCSSASSSSDENSGSSSGTIEKTETTSIEKTETQTEENIPSAGGTCSTTESSKSKSGSFAQITDGSYADKLTMQVYKNKYPNAKNDSEITKIFYDNNDMNNGYLYSNAGCLMTGVAKIASQESGQEIDLKTINEKCDANDDGLLSYDEISTGLKDILGENFDVTTDYWQKQLSVEKFEECAKNGDYVLGRALLYDVDGNKLRDDYHWVLLEGYTTDEQGRLYFTYDGTSNNDEGRKYVYGDEDLDKKEYSIDKIITVHINKNN